MSEFTSYHHLISGLLTGPEVSTRLGPSNELQGATLEVAAGTIPGRRNLNLKLGFMELLLVVAGLHDPEAIGRVAPRADLSLFTEAMSYGPRIRDQVPGLVRALRADPDTRRAVLHVSSEADGYGDRVTCTQGIQFLLRQNTLHSFVSMRSWDAVLGVPYDIMVFGGLTMCIAACLGVDPGLVSVRAGSCHVYHQTLRLLSHVDSYEDGWFEYAGPRNPEWYQLARMARDSVYLTQGEPWSNDCPTLFNLRSTVRRQGEPATSLPVLESEAIT